jgi:deoxyribodipyrimidine photo-lyase
MTHKIYSKGLFIFHRDLRIVDNIGLLQASKECKELYVCFVFTPEQVGKANTYRSSNAIQFMIESLEDLATEIKKKGGELYTFYGKQNNIIDKFNKQCNVEAVFFNKDYTPYAVERDNSTVEFCNKHHIECKSYSDYYLFEPGTITTGSKTAFKKYTPFYEHVIQKKVENPNISPINNMSEISVLLENRIPLNDAARLFTKENPHLLVHGGRKHGIHRLKQSLTEQRDYEKKRDFLTYNTSFLSAYIKFGCVSIREVYYAYKEKYSVGHGLIRELIWREFFAHVLYAFPEVVGKSYQPKFQKIKWRNSSVDFQRWCDGATGFPAVDAGMRQLNATGYMHNRLRMLTASFLIKVLLIDWREGEKYFAKNLTDYDIASNNGNWQGISGTGVDMKPYFRDMNPWIQSAKFDKDAEFIKKWVPELAEVNAKDIHKWYVAHSDPKYKSIQYSKPMVNYTEQKEKMMDMYHDALN